MLRQALSAVGLLLLILWGCEGEIGSSAGLGAVGGTAEFAAGAGTTTDSVADIAAGATPADGSATTPDDDCEGAGCEVAVEGDARVNAPTTDAGGSEPQSCGGASANACGGCASLANTPGDACGPCNSDMYVCSGADATSCDGATYENACNGCASLQVALGTLCGPCDLDAYICGGPNSSICGGVTYGGGCVRPDDVPDDSFYYDVAQWDAAWAAFEEEVLVLVNEQRAAGANCGSEGSFGPANPLTMEPRLRGIARQHSKDMYERDFFDHTNPDGVDPFDRIDATGYNWWTAAENIAGSQQSPQSVMNTWMSSAGHCANIMDPDFTDIGIGYHEAGSPTERLWTQVFAAPF